MTAFAKTYNPCAVRVSMEEESPGFMAIRITQKSRSVTGLEEFEAELSFTIPFDQNFHKLLKQGVDRVKAMAEEQRKQDQETTPLILWENHRQNSWDKVMNR